MIRKIQPYFFKSVSIAPLVVLRIVFGFLLFFSVSRYFLKGWITSLYVEPDFHFSFFSFIQPLNETGMYAVFITLLICSISIILGAFYRFGSALFFVLFTYVELLDKTYYLNHYYLVSLLTFWLALVPAHRLYSIDSFLFPKIKSANCANWHIAIFKLQLSIVYCFAGLAKVNPDWLLRAQPMATWLPGRYQIPIIGQFLHLKEIAFLFSWLGCIYDLFIWCFLWLKKFRGIAYFFVILFHILTVILFPRIGMFPFIMITSTLIFFSAEWHQNVLNKLPFYQNPATSRNNTIKPRPLITAFLIVYLLLQIYLPIRHFQIPGNLFWNEQGYRFSWRVMLMEKNGYTTFILRDPKTKKQKEIDTDLYLTPFQKQQLRSQPDLIYDFAQYIGQKFEEELKYAPQILVKSRISLNGRRSKSFINSNTDLYGLKNYEYKKLILPFEE